METMSWIAPLMFLSMAAVLMLGFPVGLTLIVHGVVFTLIGALLDQFPWAMMQAHMLRVYGLLFNEVLLAIPFFTLMGLVLERSGIAEDMIDALSKLLGALRGGLALVVVVVGTVLAATTGVIQASIIAMGLAALPTMLRAGYNSRLSAGVVAASGTLAQIIPPSLVLIVMADVTGVPIFRMYAHALVPGLVLALVYVGYIFVIVRVRPSYAPAPGSSPSSADVRAAACSLAAPVGIMMATIGSVLTGFATPTESGGFGATASLLLAIWRRRMSWTVLRGMVDSTTLISCSALFIMVGATFFTLPFNAMDGKLWMGSVFLNLPAGETGFLIACVLLVFFLAFFLDFFEIAFLALPLLMPVVVALGIDPAWFAVLICLVLQTSFMHPPFGIAIYTLRSVAPATMRSEDIYWGAVPFIAFQLLVALFVILAPGLALDVSQSSAAPLPDDQVEHVLRSLP
jgi:tripartite ATP-independent transporter DctM subunit